MLHRVAAIVVALHGLIHLIGFVVPWKLAVFDGLPYSTTVFFGLVDIGDGGARVLAIAWLGVAVALVVAAIAIWQRRSWAPGWTAGCALVSGALCVVELPSTAAGLLVDAIIVAAFVVVRPAHRRVPDLWSKEQPKPLRPH